VNKKLVALALGLTVLIMLGGIQTSFLYGTTFLNMKPGYTLSVAATNAWWDCNWSYAKKITIDHTKVQADQTNFPVLLYEGSDADLADYAQENGNDIVFVDRWNLTQYNHELEKFNGDTGELWAWVKVASLSSTSDTILYMYYGNPDCVNQENVTGSWDSSYEMIQHLDETSGATFDSTIHHNDGTPQGGITQNVAGKIDGADSFDGSDAAISCGTSESLNVTSQVTVEAWVQDPPYTKQGPPQRAHVRIVDKRNETVPLRSFHPFTVGRRITVDCDAEAIVVFFHSPGVIINEVTVAHTSVLVKKYQAGVPTSPEEQRIETIRQQLPEELTTLSTVVYSTSFSLQGGTIYPLEINVESSNPLSINGRICYLVIAADGSYDYEGSTRWILPVGFIDPRISISILNRIFDFFTKKDSAHSEYGYGKKSGHILEAGGGTIAGDTVFWENLYGRLAVYPHTSNELAKHTQYVNLTWHEMDTNIDIVFGFNEILKDYDIWMWQNMSHDVKVSDYGDLLANYTLDNITSFTVLGETPKDVDYGEVPSECYANVIIDSGDLTYNLTIAFDRYEWLNSGHTACYFEYKYYDIIGFHYEEQYWYGWKSIRNLFTDREYGGKHYYYVSNIPVKQGSTYCFKCQYTVSPNSRGKWELLAKLHTDTLEEALSSGRYVMVDPWWNGSWGCYRPITIESDYIDEPLTNFPVLVVINSTVGAKCNGGNSIRFLSTDNVTEFNYEIEFWNSSGSSYVWVNISEQIPSSSDYTFLMYYNNSVASDNQNPTGVWDSNFTAVWHLNETSGTVFDSTSNNHDSSSVMGVTQDATGKIDGGDSFDGSSDYIDITMTLPSKVTISAWAKYSIGASNDMLWCIDSDNQGPDLFFGIQSSGSIALNTWDSFSNPFCNIPTNAQQWHLYTTVIESGNTKLYINDSLGGTANYRNPTGSDFHISSSAGYDWTGTIDEVRISNKARSTAWINATYHTMNQTTGFLTWGGEISTIPPNKQIISKGRDAYTLEINPAGTILYGYINGNSVQTSIDTNWHYVSLAYDGSQIKLYKDGNLQNTSSLSGSINTTAYNLLLGQYLSGKLDEIRVSSTARSASWINTTYLNTNSPTTFATFSSPVGVLSTWTYRKKITINHSFVTATLTDFPILIFNASDTTLKTNAQSTGNDILFMSSTADWITGTWRNKLDYEIEKFDHITGELEAWVRIPTLSSSVDTIIYMYYGNTLCNTSRQNPTGVWDSNHKMVQHLEETDIDGGSGDIKDSTSNGNNGTTATMDATDQVAGKVDGSFDFDGVDDYVDVTGMTDAGTTHTIEFWAYSRDSTNASKYPFDVQTGRILVGWGSDTAGWIGIYDGTWRLFGNSPSANVWHHLVFVLDGSTSKMKMYLDGTQYGSELSYSPQAIGGAVHIGARYAQAGSWYGFNGLIDEVRISNTTRSSAWINTTFNTINKTSSFLQFGRQMMKNVAPTQGNPSPSNGATGQNLNPPLRISVNDTNQDALNVTFRTNASGSWTTIGTNTSVTNGSYQQIPSTMNYPGVSYYWSVNVTDGLLWMNATYHFTTIPAVPFDATTSDGWIENSSGLYVTARNASGGSVSASAMIFYVGQKFDPMGYFIYKGFTFFNTSAIPDDATITSATLSLYGEVDASDQDFFLIIQNGQPASPHDPLQSDDYYHGNYSGNGGSLNTTGFSSSGYNNITLNSTGRSWINKTGMTKLCLRSSRDINSIAPTINEYVRIYTSEQGSGYKPKLIVVYTG